MESGWVVKKDGKEVAHGPIYTIATDDVVRSMYDAGYKTYIDGRIHKPAKDKRQGGRSNG